MKIKCVKKNKTLKYFQDRNYIRPSYEGTISLGLTNDYSKQSNFIEITRF